MVRPRPLVCALGLLALLAPPAASAQTNLQLWGNATLDGFKTQRLVYELQDAFDWMTVTEIHKAMKVR